MAKETTQDVDHTVAGVSSLHVNLGSYRHDFRPALSIPSGRGICFINLLNGWEVTQSLPLLPEALLSILAARNYHTSHSTEIGILQAC